MMTGVLAHNITSPLGVTSTQNYMAVKSGHSGLHMHDGKWPSIEPFTASLIPDTINIAIKGHTRFESMVISSIQYAVEQTNVDISSTRTILIISTTKGNIELLDKTINQHPDLYAPEREYPGGAAQAIARELGFTTMPIVVCNACTSGASALILADRLLTAGLYDTAVVTGADAQCPFIVSGFQSLKALSPTPCRPFDAHRDGLNLGEASATIILSNQPSPTWQIASGAIRNDANHISGPSRTGEGSYLALKQVINEDNIAFVNVHGTATSYNDEMESIALERAGLTSTPVNALKGYYGHTMGAAGILEAIISMCAIDDNTILATKGFKEKGVSGNITINNTNTTTQADSFIKLLSGFGGCNTAIRMTRRKTATNSFQNPQFSEPTMLHRVTITPSTACIDGQTLSTQHHGRDMLVEIYRKQKIAYPKFFKMDLLSKLGFIASELLLATEGDKRRCNCEDRAVILFNRSSSIISDKQHQDLINDPNNYFPSPSIFVYTLPNIITGEIAIRNKYYGETSLYILPQRDDGLMWQVYKASMLDTTTKSIIGGWIECPDEDDFQADLYIIE